MIDANTGQGMRMQALRSTSAGFSRADSESMLISRLTDDIRGLLGLSGYTPYPVTGAKRDVVRPQTKPAVNIAMPLLDVTPTAKPSIPAAAAAPPANLIPALEMPTPNADVTVIPVHADDEPCIITLEKDCGDPDGR